MAGSRNPFPRPQVLLVEGPCDDSGKTIVQMVPASEELADYRQRLIELVTALAVIEDHSAPAVLDDMLSVPQERAAST